MSNSWHHSSRSQYNGKHSNFDIEEEYQRTLRTKSYEDIVKEFQKELNPITHTEEEEEEIEETEGEEEFLVPHVQELASVFSEGPDQAPLRGLLRDYIESGTKAYDYCYLLLKSIKRARTNVGILRRFVRMYKYPSREGTAEQRRRILTDLVRIAQIDNPLSQPGLVSSPATEGVYAPVIPRLKSLQRRVGRRRGLVDLCLKAMGIVMPPWGASRRGERQPCGLARLGGRLDAAARGAYALDREFHTVGRMLARVNDKLEHIRAMVRAVLQNRPGWYPWGEVVRRLQTEEGWLLEQLQELEEHAYLCLLTIHRARNPLVQELTSLASPIAKR